MSRIAPGSAAAGAPGQRPRRIYLNRFTGFFFTQLDMLSSSHTMYMLLGCAVGFAGWRVLMHYATDPAYRPPVVQYTITVPLKKEHKIKWGLMPPDASDSAMVEHSDGTAAASSNNDGSSSSNNSNKSNNTQQPLSRQPSPHHPQPRARLVHAEASEMRGRDVVCMEVVEYDAQRECDVRYRSVSYVHTLNNNDTQTGGGGGGTGKSAHASRATRRSKSGEVEMTPAMRKRMWSWRRGDDDDGSSNNTGGVPSDYRAYMPRAGEQVLHGMTKCVDIGDDNNCIPAANHLQDELSRKLMVTLGPVHTLRDMLWTPQVIRLTPMKEAPLRALVIGLHSGELPSWLSRTYTNFHVDVVEADGALARVCRRFLGFSERNNLTLHVTDPIAYVRHLAASATAVRHRDAAAAAAASNRFGLLYIGGLPKRQRNLYDLVLLHPVDGDGKLSTTYGKLDFIANVREVMGPNGCVALVLPNLDASFVYMMVQNWRIAFADRVVALVHCTTAPYTMLMTFQDQLPSNANNFGTLENAAELQDLLRAHINYYGMHKMPFDLPNEVNEANLSIFKPGQTYNIDAYLPRRHPAATAAAAATHTASN